MGYIYGLIVFAIEVCLFRELFGLLQCSEFVIGLMYAVWFVGSGIGVWVGRRLLFSTVGSKTSLYMKRWFSWNWVVLFVFLLLSKVIKFLPSFAIGKPPSLLEEVVIVFGVLFFPSIICGMGFTFLQGLSKNIGDLFFQECISFGIAGFVAVFLFMIGVDSEYLGLFCLWPVLLVRQVFSKWEKVRLVIFFTGASVLFLTMPCLDCIWQTVSGRTILKMNSPYGRLEVKEKIVVEKNERKKDIYSLFYNGRFVSDFTSSGFAEVSVHPGCLQLKQYNVAVVIGDMCRLAVGEVLKYPFKKIFVLEKDPNVLKLEKLLYKSDKITWVKGISVERLKKIGVVADFVWLGISDPLTLSDASFLSIDFMRQVKSILSKDGILAIPIYGDLDFLSLPLLDYTAVIYKSLKDVFPIVRYMPNSPAVMLASVSVPIDFSKDAMRAKYDLLGLKNKYFSPYLWDVFLAQERLDMEQRKVVRHAINEGRASRLVPNVYEKFVRFNIFLFDRWLWNFIDRLEIGMVVLFFLILFIGSMFVVKGKNIISVMWFGSFLHLAWHMVIILYVQSVWSGFFQDVGLFAGIYMVALGLGSRMKVRLREYLLLFNIVGLGMLWFIFVPISKWICFLFVFMNAFLHGILFSNCFSLCDFTSGNKVYVADLVGSSLAALLISPFLIPKIGMFSVVLSLILVSFIWFSFFPERFPLGG